MKRHGRFVLVLVAVVAVAQVAIGYSVLPESMASHFDATGSPDAWTGRDAFGRHAPEPRTFLRKE
ncbi:MAG TPA: DUF1648 domain-containing protein [Thermoanaerobaculia bacterium]|nr:DUF1648 domain-containing protein [Thermoanaerobaculia bacterium]